MKPCKHGHAAERTRDNRCSECKRLHGLRYRTANAAQIAARKAKHRRENPDAYQEQYARRDVKERRAAVTRSKLKTRAVRRAVVLLRMAKRRAVEKGVPYNLDAHVAHYQNVIDAGSCQETGLAFDMLSRRGPFVPSLDRINPQLGYVHGNVRIILWGLNCGFGDFGEETYAKIATAFLQSRNKSSKV